MTVLVKMAGNPMRLARPMREAIHRAGPEIAVLKAAGIYGLLAYSVGGATPANLLRMILAGRRGGPRPATPRSRGRPDGVRRSRHLQARSELSAQPGLVYATRCLGYHEDGQSER
jgi:hypothetical protein